MKNKEIVSDWIKRARRSIHAKVDILRGMKITKDDLPKLRDWRNSPHIRAYAREYHLLNILTQKRMMT